MNNSCANNNTIAEDIEYQYAIEHLKASGAHLILKQDKWRHFHTENTSINEQFISTTN